MSRLNMVVMVLSCAMGLAACRKADEAPSPPATVTAKAPGPAPAAPAAPAAAPGATAPAATDQAVPVLRVPTIDGATFELAAHRGKWVVVNFWATWCAPCLKEMPELSALDAMRNHIDVVGLAYEEIEPVAMRAFLKAHPVVYPIAILDPYAPPADFDTPRGLPMTYLISPDGKIAKKILGPVTARELDAAIASAGGPALLDRATGAAIPPA